MRSLKNIFARSFGVAIITGLFVLFGGVGVVKAQSGSRKVIRLDAIKVEGRIQKPQAFYVLQRSNLNFEGLELKRSFISTIIESIEEKPF